MKRTVIALICYAVATAAAGDVQVGRYAVIPPTATGPQQFPLLAVSQYRFPSSIRTITDAVGFILLQTGYALAPAISRDPRAETMLAAPLPRAQRDLGPIRVDHALRALAGPGFELVVDPIHRLVAFDVVAAAWTGEQSKQDVNAPVGRGPESPR